MTKNQDKIEERIEEIIDKIVGRFIKEQSATKPVTQVKMESEGLRNDLFKVASQAHQQEREKCKKEKIKTAEESFRNGKIKERERVVGVLRDMKKDPDEDAPWFGQVKKVNGYNLALKEAIERIEEEG